MSILLNADTIATLKGAELKSVAKELGIWKSKMKADELRAAILATAEAEKLNDLSDVEETEAILSDPATMAEIAAAERELDTWRVQPNRADRRREAKRLKKLNRNR